MTHSFLARHSIATLLLAASTHGLCSYADAVLADQPVAYYRLNDAIGSSLASDSSGNGNHGLVSGNVVFGVPGPTGATAAKIEYLSMITIPDSTGMRFPGNHSITIEFWLRSDRYKVQMGDNVESIVAKGFDRSAGSWRIYDQSEVSPVLYSSDPIGTSTSSWSYFGELYALHQWHHFVVTVSQLPGKPATVIRNYINGCLTAESIGHIGFITRNAEPLVIGMLYNWGYYFEGYLSDVAIYDGALTHEQILNHYNEAREQPSLQPIENQHVFELNNQGFTPTILTFTAQVNNSLPGQPLAFSLDEESLDKGMTIDPVTGEFSWDPDESHDGLHEVTVSVSQAPCFAQSTQFTVEVVDVNEPPVIVVPGSISTMEHTEISIAILASDGDTKNPNGIADLLTYSMASGSDGATINSTTGVITWVPSEAQDGRHVFVVRVSDNGTPTLFAEGQFEVLVSEVNSPPVLSALPDRLVYEANNVGRSPTIVAFTATAVDLDTVNPGGVPNRLTFSIDASSLGKGMAMDPTTGTFFWAPGSGQRGVHDVDLMVVDDGAPGLSDSRRFQITVLAASGGGPLIRPEDVLVYESNNRGLTPASVTFTVHLSIPNPTGGVVFSLDSDSQARGMSITEDTGLFSWVPQEADDGVHSVVVFVSDRATPPFVDSVQFFISVSEVNEEPALESMPVISGRVGMLLAIRAKASDVDLVNPGQIPNVLRYAVDSESAAKGITIDNATGQIQWLPNVSHIGEHLVRVSVLDNGEPILGDEIVVQVDVSQGPFLSGVIFLEDVVSMAGRIVTVQVREHGVGGSVSEHPLVLDMNGAFSVALEKSGNYDVSVRGETWLRRTVMEIDVPEVGYSGLALRLVNGDVNGDGSVNIQDFLILRASFGSVFGGSGYVLGADLNRDGSVSVADFLIVRKNFGRSGDPW